MLDIVKINAKLLVLYARIKEKPGILTIKRYKLLTRLSVISTNIWYNLTWQMMLDIIMSISFLPVQNEYQATHFICQN